MLNDENRDILLNQIARDSIMGQKTVVDGWEIEVEDDKISAFHFSPLCVSHLNYSYYI